MQHLLPGSGAPATVQGSLTFVLRHLAPALVATVALGSLVGMTVYTVVMAPIASIYQQLTGAPDAA